MKTKCVEYGFVREEANRRKMKSYNIRSMEQEADNIDYELKDFVHLLPIVPPHHAYGLNEPNAMQFHPVATH